MAGPDGFIRPSMSIVSILSLVGAMTRIHSKFSAVAISVQSGVVCPSRRQGLTSSQTNTVSWSVLSDDNDLITALIVFFGSVISHLQFSSSHNCFSGKI